MAGGVAIHDDEIRVTIADFGATDARSLQASLIDQHSSADSARVFENAPRALMCERLIRFLYDPLLLHPLGKLLRIFTFKLEMRFKNHELIQAAFAIGEHEL